MARVYTMDELERMRKKAAAREWLADKKQKAKQFWDENKQWAGPALVAGATYLGKATLSALKQSSVDKEINYKDHHVYDPRSGCYVEVKHKLSTREQVELDALRNGGMSVTAALDEMGLLR